MQIPALFIPADITRPMTVVQLDPDYNAMYSLIGCNLVTVVRPSASLRNMVDGDCTVWVDDEGLLRENPRQNIRAFLMTEQHLVGNALLTGVDNAAGTITPLQFVLPACTVLNIIEQNAQGLHRIYAAIDAANANA
jgi:hypothetical protein